MAEKEETLPYVFDLLFDIKTESHLLKEVNMLRVTLREMERVAKEHGIDLPEPIRVTTD